MMIRPTGERVLILRDEAPTQTPSGLYIPQTVEKDGPIQGTVVAVGTKVDPTLVIGEGTRVLAPRYAGQEVKIDEKTYLLLPVAELLGVIEG